MNSTTSYEEILHGLVHDLRQPLGNLETGLFYLDLILPHSSERVREQMAMMQHQMAQAANLLDRAAEELRARGDQTFGAASLARTNSASAGVT